MQLSIVEEYYAKLYYITSSYPYSILHRGCVFRIVSMESPPHPSTKYCLFLFDYLGRFYCIQRVFATTFIAINSFVITTQAH